MADLRNPTITEAADAPKAAEQPQQTRISFAGNPNMGTAYTNAFQTSFSKNEVFLTACISQASQDKEGPVLSIQPQQRLVMSPESAKRLAAAMIQVVKQYEEQNGAINV